MNLRETQQKEGYVEVLMKAVFLGFLGMRDKFVALKARSIKAGTNQILHQP